MSAVTWHDRHSPLLATPTRARPEAHLASGPLLSVAVLLSFALPGAREAVLGPGCGCGCSCGEGL